MSGIVETVTLEIDGARYEHTTWPATVALERLAECVALLGEDGVAALVASDAGGMLGAAATVARNATQAQGGIAGFARRMLRTTVRVSVINGATVRESCSDEFDAIFTGRLVSLGKVVLEVAKRNFALA